MPINYNQAAEKYAANRLLNSDVLQSLLGALQRKPGMRFLEVGCGTGNYIIALQEITGCEAHGIDPSEGMRAKALARSAPVHIIPGQGEAIPFEDDYFDFVYEVDVIHHVQDQARYYNEAMRVLKPGGMICSVTDSEEMIRNRRPLAVYFPETIENEVRRYPSIDKLRKLMEEAGFSNIHETDVALHRDITNITAYRDKSFSSLHLISEEDFQRGIQKMEADLQKGPILGISTYALLWGEKQAS